jgi:hypothetical protein
MHRVAFLLLLGSVTALSVASDANEVLRTKEDTYKPLKATKQQADVLHKIDDKYGVMLAKLRKDKPADYTIKRDALNDKYTRDFMAAMTPIQKSTYRKYVRSLRQSYIKAHPEVDADNIFIWGGSNLL